MPIVNIAKTLIRRQSDGKYLILRSSVWEERADRSQQPDLPGGTVEPGEAILTGAVREIFEETGITLSPEELMLVHAETFQSTSDQASINRMIYCAELREEYKVKLSWEHEEFWWMDAAEVMALKIRQPYPEIFRYLNTIGVLV